MSRRLTIIQRHPDPAGNRLCHALADAYAGGAANVGHAVTRIDVARLDFRSHAHNRILSMEICLKPWLRRETRLCRHSTCS
jgi:putative NADPH-quinone reductase